MRFWLEVLRKDIAIQKRQSPLHSDAPGFLISYLLIYLSTYLLIYLSTYLLI
ncbi:hypothetical protein M565_ctg1P1400 [Vibrio cyclitrophicus FF75]|nr:hypothetical protein M565_ctg1P1400 [Vibrio cyclitrophicus FF75]